MAFVLAALAFAQYRVNTQANNRVNPELYGGGAKGSMRYSANTTLLPSEARYATWKSGALPSEVRMNYLATGPLAPSGSIAYIPGPSPVQQAMKLPQPQLYNPAYQISGSTGQKPVSAGPINAQVPNGSIRYNSPAGPAPSSMMTGQTPWSQPLNTGAPLTPPSSPTPQPPQINRPPVTGNSSPPAPNNNPPPSGSSSSSPALTPGVPGYLSLLSGGGSVKYSGSNPPPAK
jgi:hypothetical protein